jgi:hypothetical protein
MFRELASQASHVLPIISTVMCSSLFAVLFIYVMTDRRRSHHRTMEHLPLDDGKGTHV